MEWVGLTPSPYGDVSIGFQQQLYHELVPLSHGVGEGSVAIGVAGVHTGTALGDKATTPLHDMLGCKICIARYARMNAV